jgi:glucose-6-phosphate 1-dehydrogenase
MSVSLKNAMIIKPFNAIVYGGDGDLAFRKIYPALFHRFVDKQLPTDFKIFAITRSDKKHGVFFQELRNFILQSATYDYEKDLIDVFFKKMRIIVVANHTEADYQELKLALEEQPNYQNV